MKNTNRGDLFRSETIFYLLILVTTCIYIQSYIVLNRPILQCTLTFKNLIAKSITGRCLFFYCSLKTVSSLAHSRIFVATLKITCKNGLFLLNIIYLENLILLFVQPTQ